ncbi:MAG: hypothetical protein J7L15_00990 [Clostridiales bacterium]|nr:hypothetical protein [Clostridiales bacterium]
MLFTKTIQIPVDEAKEMQKYVESVGQDGVATVKSYTVDFPNSETGEGDIAIDIKVCVGDPPFIDPVIFQDNYEVGCLEPAGTLLGEYRFSHFLKNRYIVILEADYSHKI